MFFSGLENKKVKRFINFILLSIIILVFGYGYYLLFKNGYGLFCPFSEFFNIDCPFCGLTRMCAAIIELRFFEAFKYNQSAFLLSPFAILLYLKWGIYYIKTGIIMSTEFENKFVIVCFYIMMVFGLFRYFVLGGI